MTMQPAQGPGRMPNPIDYVRADVFTQRRDMRRGLLLILEAVRQQSLLLARLVELAEANKAALDAMQAGEASEFSVKGLADADADSPFIGT